MHLLLFVSRFSMTWVRGDAHDLAAMRVVQTPGPRTPSPGTIPWERPRSSAPCRRVGPHAHGRTASLAPPPDGPGRARCPLPPGLALSRLTRSIADVRRVDPAGGLGTRGARGS